MTNDRLSPAQRRAIVIRQQPKRHAMDRLKERYMTDIKDDDAENLIDVMITLCSLASHLGNNTSTVRLVSRESNTSVIYDLDMFEDGKTIRVCYDPQANNIRTVLPLP